MKFKKNTFLLFLFIFSFYFCLSTDLKISTDINDLVEITKINPNIQIDIKYATTNNFTNQILYDSQKCYLRKKVAKKLNLIQQELEKKGLGLKVWDGYRPLSAQKKMWAIFPDPNLVADPSKGSNHNRGAAVDVTLINLKNNSELEMPTPFDELTERAAIDYTNGISKAAIQNREFLQNIMKKYDLEPYQNEWWHFNDKNCKTYAILDVNFVELEKKLKEKSNLKKGIVCVSVADLKGMPIESEKEIKYPISPNDNLYQLSQALLGEKVLILEKNKDWLKVQAIEQKIYTPQEGWHPLQCFLKKDQVIPVKKFPKNNIVVKKQWAKIYSNPNLQSNPILSVSIGTKLNGKIYNNNLYKVKLPNGKNGVISKEDVNNLFQTKKQSTQQIRQNLVVTAKTFLDSPYSWGGRSAFNPEMKTQATSPDCSAFANLVYLSNGIKIPRNSHSQFLKSHEISGENLKPGDLIFLASPQTPKNMHHVLIYLGNDQIIESTINSKEQKNRIISAQEKFGTSIIKMKSGEKYGNGELVYFGSYIK